MRTIIISGLALAAMTSTTLADQVGKLRTLAEFNTCVQSTNVGDTGKKLVENKHYKAKSSDELAGGVSWLLEGNLERSANGAAAIAVLKGCERFPVATK